MTEGTNPIRVPLPQAEAPTEATAETHTVVCQEIYVQDDGKYVPQGHFPRAQQMTCKAVRRTLCGVAYSNYTI